MPSPSPTAQTLMDTLLGVASAFVLPDWNALRNLFPVFLGLLFIAWFAFTARKWATVGPRRRAPARVEPIPPAGVHMPGGSVAPILAALGAAALIFGLVAGGVALWVGVILLVVTLGFWYREGVRDYDRLEPRERLPAVVQPAVPHEPPPGVHMPGPSIRPLLGALGTAALLGGLVVGGWVLVLAVVFLVYTLVGWLVDFTAEYRKVEEADQTGHLENIPTRPLPVRSLQVWAVVFALAGLWQLGIFPPASTSAGGPGASGAPAGSGGPAPAPGGPITIVAQGIEYDKKALEVAAGQPFTIHFENKDQATTTHDIDIRDSNGAVLKDQPPVPGGQSDDYRYDALQPGTYTYICSFHPIPMMTGTLTVK
jgi:plastocyanin